MKWQGIAAAILAGAFLVIAGCNNTPVQSVDVPRADDPSAYRPMPAPKPLPPAGYVPGGLPPTTPYPGGQPAVGPGPAPAPGGLTVSPNPSIENEDVFVAAYAKRSPRIMVFVNRTIQGDPLPKDGMDEVMRVENIQSATGAVAVNNTNTLTGSSQATSSVYYGAAPRAAISIATHPAASPPAGRRRTPPARWSRSPRISMTFSGPPATTMT